MAEKPRDFPGLVIGVMKSWSHSLETKKSRDDDGVVMEHELTSADGGDDAPNLEETASDSSTPLDQLEAQEHDAKGQSLLAILKAQFGPQRLETKILEAIMNTSFETHEEIRSALGAGARQPLIYLIQPKLTWGRWKKFVLNLLIRNGAKNKT